MSADNVEQYHQLQQKCNVYAVRRSTAERPRSNAGARSRSSVFSRDFGPFSLESDRGFVEASGGGGRGWLRPIVASPSPLEGGALSGGEHIQQSRCVC